jgi:hypothetical protein
MGILPLSVHKAKVLAAKQIVDIEGGWVSDVADLEFDTGYRARWTAHGLLTMTPSEETPIELDVSFQHGRLMSIDGTPLNFLAKHADTSLPMRFRRGQSTVLVLSDVSRVDRDRFDKLAMLTKEHQYEEHSGHGSTPPPQS